MVDPLGKSRGRQPFPIGLPFLSKGGEGKRRASRSPLCASFQMPKQQRFVAGMLPDQPQPGRLRQRLDLCVTVRRDPELVIIQQDEHAFICTASFRPLAGALNGKLDQREWIATARLEQDGVEMNGDAHAVRNTAEQGNIALLAFSLAADEQTAALRDDAARLPAHPILGRAP